MQKVKVRDTCKMGVSDWFCEKNSVRRFSSQRFQTSSTSISLESALENLHNHVKIFKFGGEKLILWYFVDGYLMKKVLFVVSLHTGLGFYRPACRWSLFWETFTIMSRFSGLEEKTDFVIFCRWLFDCKSSATCRCILSEFCQSYLPSVVIPLHPFSAFPMINVLALPTPGWAPEGAPERV